MSAFLDMVTRYIETSVAPKEAKTAALEAAKTVAEYYGPYAQELQGVFVQWLSQGNWRRQPPTRPFARLPKDSLLSEVAIRECFPSLSHKEAVRRAAEAWEARVSHCAEALKAGWPPEEAACFACTQEELREAVVRSGHLRRSTQVDEYAVGG